MHLYRRRSRSLRISTAELANGGQTGLVEVAPGLLVDHSDLMKATGNLVNGSRNIALVGSSLVHGSGQEAREECIASKSSLMRQPRAAATRLSMLREWPS